MTALFRNFRLMVLLAAAIVITLPPPAVAAENPLQAHRDRAARKAFETVQLKAVVVQTIGDEQLVLAISPGQFKSSPFESGDQVRIHIAGKTLATRFITQEAYDQIMHDSALRETLDVDVLCLLNSSSHPGKLVVVGLGGGLVTWLNARPGMAALIEWWK